MVVLLLEDQRATRDLFSDHLGRRGLAAEPIRSGYEALAATAAAGHDAVVLDIGLPGTHGMGVLRHLRVGHHADLPAPIPAARDAVSARVDGLDAGADEDPLAAFDPAEPGARLRAVPRRSGPRRDAVRRHGGMVSDPASPNASADGTGIALTRREAAVSEDPTGPPGRNVTRDSLEDRLRGVGHHLRSGGGA